MRPFSCIAALCAAATSLVVLGAGTNVRAQTLPPPAVGSPASSPLLKPRTWLVDNKDRLVTVKEKDGPPLFAQVITTNDLHIGLQMTAATKEVVLTLKDANGKHLYSMTLPHLDHGTFQFGADFGQSAQKGKTGGTSFTLTPATEDQSLSGEKTKDGTLLFVLNPDNWPVRGDFTDGSSRTLIDRVGTKMTMTSFENRKKTSERVIAFDIDKKRITATEDGKEIGAANFSDPGVGIKVYDEKGEVLSRVVKQDDEDYTEFTLGERKILVAGVNWHFDLKDGVLTLKPNAAAAPAAPNTANK